MATFTNTWNENTPIDYSTSGNNEAGKIDDVLRQLMLDTGERILKYSPVGMVSRWPGDLVPDGFMECNGRSLLRSEYPELFSLLGSYHGSADADHFNIPKINGYFTRGWDHAAAVDPDSATRTITSATGATMADGDHVGTVQDDEFVSHGNYYYYNNGVGSGGAGLGGGGLQETSSMTTDTSSETVNTESTPANIYVKYIIRVKPLDYDSAENLRLQGIRPWDENMPINSTYMGRVARYMRWRRRDIYERLKNFFPTGDVSYWPSETVPTSWLECNGAEVSRTTYSELFQAIGIAYGPGDGSTTFNLPDYRGYFLRAQDSGAGIDSMSSSRSGRGDGSGGDVAGSVQASGIKKHSHVYKKRKINRWPWIGIAHSASSLLFWTSGQSDMQYDPDRDVDGRPKNIYMMAIIFARGVS